MFDAIGKQISALRKEKGLSQKELAARLSMCGVEVSNQAVSKWENGSTLPNAQQFLTLCTVLEIEDVLGCFGGGGGLLTGLDQNGRTKALEYITLLRLSGLYTPAPIPSDARRLPLYSIAVSAGTGQLLDTSDYELVEADNSVPAAANFGVRISGDSMEPRFHHGQIVWVRQQPTLESGQLGVFLYDDNAYLKRLHKDAHGTRLVSLNPSYPDIHIDGRSELRIMGRVLEA